MPPYKNQGSLNGIVSKFIPNNPLQKLIGITSVAIAVSRCICKLVRAPVEPQ